MLPIVNCVKTKPKQTQYKANTNPIPERPKMNENLFATKGYENITTFRLRQNKPNQTQPVVSLPALSLVEVSNQSKGSNLFHRAGRWG